jgi:hypothetical protein
MLRQVRYIFDRMFDHSPQYQAQLAIQEDAKLTFAEKGRRWIVERWGNNEPVDVSKSAQRDAWHQIYIKGEKPVVAQQYIAKLLPLGKPDKKEDKATNFSPLDSKSLDLNALGVSELWALYQQSKEKIALLDLQERQERIQTPRAQHKYGTSTGRIDTPTAKKVFTFGIATPRKDPDATVVVGITPKARNHALRKRHPTKGRSNISGGFDVSGKKQNPEISEYVAFEAQIRKTLATKLMRDARLNPAIKDPAAVTIAQFARAIAGIKLEKKEAVADQELVKRVEEAKFLANTKHERPLTSKEQKEIELYKKAASWTVLQAKLSEFIRHNRRSHNLSQYFIYPESKFNTYVNLKGSAEKGLNVGFINVAGARFINPFYTLNAIAGGILAGAGAAFGWMANKMCNVMDYCIPPIYPKTRVVAKVIGAIIPALALGVLSLAAVICYGVGHLLSPTSWKNKYKAIKKARQIAPSLDRPSTAKPKSRVIVNSLRISQTNGVALAMEHKPGKDLSMVELSRPVDQKKAQVSFVPSVSIEQSRTPSPNPAATFRVLQRQGQAAFSLAPLHAPQGQDGTSVSRSRPNLRPLSIGLFTPSAIAGSPTNERGRDDSPSVHAQPITIQPQSSPSQLGGGHFTSRKSLIVTPGKLTHTLRPAGHSSVEQNPDVAPTRTLAT